jgi:hypothetical protein
MDYAEDSRVSWLEGLGTARWEKLGGWVSLYQGPALVGDESVLVLIGRYLQADKIQREWRQCWMLA